MRHVKRLANALVFLAEDKDSDLANKLEDALSRGLWHTAGIDMMQMMELYDVAQMKAQKPDVYADMMLDARYRECVKIELGEEKGIHTVLDGYEMGAACLYEQVGDLIKTELDKYKDDYEAECQGSAKVDSQIEHSRGDYE